MNKPKKQHYVPQFLLRNFAVGKKQKARLWVLDKRTGSVHEVSVRDAGEQNKFYEYADESGVVNAEPALEKLDSKAAAVISDILRTSRFPETHESSFAWLRYYVAAQMLRIPAVRADMDKLKETIVQWSGEEVAYEDEPSPIAAYIAENTKLSAIALLREGTPEMAEILREKIWIICEATSKTSFILGDNPVCKDNLIRRPGRGNLGLKNEGIQLYLPISPRLLIHVICSKFGRMALHTPGMPTDYTKAIRNEGAMLHEPENVEYANSLQVIQAERYIFARHADDLSIALDMLKTNPELRDGDGWGLEIGPRRSQDPIRTT